MDKRAVPVPSRLLSAYWDGYFYKKPFLENERPIFDYLFLVAITFYISRIYKFLIPTQNYQFPHQVQNDI